MSTLSQTVAAAVAPPPYRVTVGLRPLNLSEWIEEADDFEAQLMEKHRLAHSQRVHNQHDIVALGDDAKETCEELVALLAAHVLEHFPTRYADRSDHLRRRIEVMATGDVYAYPGDSWDPMTVAGLLVPEDLCLMRADNRGAYYLLAASLELSNPLAVKREDGQNHGGYSRAGAGLCP